MTGSATPAAPDGTARPVAGGARGGLTLIEVVFAVGLLAIFLLGMFSTLATAMKSDALTREHQAASDAAMRQLDLVVSIPNFPTIQRSVGTTPVPAYAFEATYGPPRAGTPPKGTLTLPALATADVPLNADDAGTAGADESTWAGRVVVVTDPDGDGSTDLVEVRVTVAWRAADNRPARVDVVSRRAQ